MARGTHLIVVLTLGPLAAAPAAGQIPAPRTGRGTVLVDHQPTGAGGRAADTLFIDLLGLPNSSLLADDILLDEPAVVQRIKWWGFYHLDNPPAQEQMRVRFYDARPGDGLPGQVQYEATIQNPSRVATGRRIPVSVFPREFLFDVLLAEPFALREGAPYWLEIVQIGDIDSFHRWETGFNGNRRFAFTSASFPEWQLVENAQDMRTGSSVSPNPRRAACCSLGPAYCAADGAPGPHSMPPEDEAAAWDEFFAWLGAQDFTGLKSWQRGYRIQRNRADPGLSP